MPCTFSIQKCLYYSSFSLLSYKFLQIHIYFFFVFKILFKFLQKIKSLKNSHFSKGKETAANECNYRNRVYMDYICKASRIIHKVITVSIWWNLYKKLLASNWNYRHYFLPSIQPPQKYFFLYIVYSCLCWGSIEMNHDFYLLGFYRFSLSVTDRKQTPFLMLPHWYPLDKRFTDIFSAGINSKPNSSSYAQQVWINYRALRPLTNTANTMN